MDAIIIDDELSKHAVGYRQVAWFAQRPSGREAYRAMYVIASRLLERSARLS